MYKELIGKTITKIDNGEQQIRFTFDDDEVWLMEHYQDCCEYVYVEDIVGDLDDLLNSPLTMAEESSSEDPTPERDQYDYSYTWTYYRFATIKGYVTIRWFGSSNGCYSEDVDFYNIKKDRWA